MKNTSKEWFIYIVRCNDDTLYTGIAIDVESRIEKHNAKKGAKYTRNRTPVKLEAVFGPVENRSIASTVEYNIKELTKQEKEALITGYYININEIYIDFSKFRTWNVWCVVSLLPYHKSWINDGTDVESIILNNERKLKLKNIIDEN